MYLGAKLCKNRVWAWAKSSVKYIWEAVRNCKAHTVSNYSGRYRLLESTDNIVKMGYDPELDASPI